MLLLMSSTSALANGDAAAGLQAMKELNVIVLGNMTAMHDVEGKTFVGGNLTGNGTFGIGNAAQGMAPSTRPTLSVGGNATNAGNVNNGPNGSAGPISASPSVVIGGNATNLNVNGGVGSIQVGGNITGPFNNKDQSGFTIRVGGNVAGPHNPGGADMQYKLGKSFADPLRAGLDAETDTLRANLTALSAAMGAFDTTAGSGIDYSDHNDVRLTAVAGDNGFAVINTDAKSFFGQTSGLTYDFAPGLTTIVNITGTSAIWNLNTLSGSAYNPFVIFNFVDATSIIMDGMVHGSILAPYTNVTGPNTPIEGTLVANNFVQRGENHLGTFGGDIPFDTPAVPEISTWAMLITGFGLVGLSMRRRHKITMELS